MRKSLTCTSALVLLACLVGCAPRATETGAPATNPGLPVLTSASFTSGEAFEALPPGEVLLTVDAGTLLNQTIPTTLAGAADQKAKYDKGLAEMQDEAGIDPKQLKLVALSFANVSGDKPQVAGVMTGSFDTAKLSEVLRKDPKTGVEAQTEQYNGQTLYVRKMNDGTEFGAAVLDSGTLVVGWPAARARQAIDARAGTADNATKDAALFSAFKSTDQAAVLRFAMKFPKDKISAEEVAKDETARSVAAINYITGSVAATSGLGLHLTAKTSSPAEAQPLHDNLQKFLESGKSFMSRSEETKSVASVLNSTTIAVNGSDVDLTMNIGADQLAAIASDAGKLGASFAGAMGASPGPPHAMDDDEHDTPMSEPAKPK